MNTEKLEPALIIMGLIGVLTFLYTKTQENDVEKHHEVVLAFQNLSYQDSLLNESILEFKADRFSNYDPITANNKKINEHFSWLKSEESGLYTEINDELDNAITNAETQFATKLALIERFKSHNGVLKNSLNYLPTAIEQSQEDSRLFRYRTDLNLLLQQILLFSSSPNQLNKSKASSYVEKLKKSKLKPITEISQHAGTIIDQRTTLQKVVNEIFNLPTKQNVEKIYQLYSEHNAELIESASSYRTAMYAMAMLTLFYVLQLFLTLRSTMQRLEDTLSEVEFQKYALDKHAIVASINPDKNVDYVNDKFAEISQYSKEELMGQPWSILHTNTLSDTNDMWPSLSLGERWAGEIKNTRKDGSLYWLDANIIPYMDKLGNPIRFVALLTDITERKLDEERIFNLAHYDGLTELPNRAFFMHSLELALSDAHDSNSKLALLFLDLDNFKSINDTMGHAAGDELLKVFATHLLASVDNKDIVSRLGGDEFTVVLNNTQSAQEIEAVVEKIVSITNSSITLGRKDIVISTSIGISVFPDNGNDSDTLLQNADIAMYKAKADGKNNHTFFSDELKTTNLQRHAVENDLRAAIVKNEFELYYQPQQFSETGEICALEALIRWNHPEKGLIPPDVFIPILEESGLIIEVGQWVLTQACSELIALKNLGFQLRMAVNVSAYQVRDNHLVDFIEQLLTSQAIQPEELELELTESSFLQNTDSAISILTSLSDLGVGLSLDDFGTGYSSLSYLKKLPINTLKIDRSFVSGLPNDQHDLAIASTILAMAKSLNINVVAEGVETEDQMAFFREHRCEYLQGYYISKPLPANELQAFLFKHPTMSINNRLIA